MKLGDLVTLKTGYGPMMVLDDLTQGPEGVVYGCTWFDEQKFEFMVKTFLEPVLEFHEFKSDYELHAGMQVQLRSGAGPAIVLEKIQKANFGGDLAKGVWWNERLGEFVSEDFHVHVLKPLSI